MEPTRTLYRFIPHDLLRKESEIQGYQNFSGACTNLYKSVLHSIFFSFDTYMSMQLFSKEIQHGMIKNRYLLQPVPVPQAEPEQNQY
jgi:hypothetical protein